MSALAGKTVLVTGAGRGIGRAIADGFLAAGAFVFAAARSGGELSQVVSAAGEERAAALLLDVTDEGACEAAVSACEERRGPLDVLVNNAGGATSSSFLRTDTELWRRMMAVNAEGPFWLTRAALPGMLRRGAGSVVTVASLASRRGFPYVAAYGASKHAVLGMTRSLAAEYADSGVTFNCVCPHYVDTQMTTATVENIVAHTGRDPEQALAPLLTPQGRLIGPDEVAALVLHLASPAGRSINGQAINLDGGECQS